MIHKKQIFKQKINFSNVEKEGKKPLIALLNDALFIFRLGPNIERSQISKRE